MLCLSRETPRGCGLCPLITILYCIIWDNELQLERNEYLKVQGSTDTRLYYVTEGCLRIFVVDEFEEHTIRFAYSGNFIAALDSFIT